MSAEAVGWVWRHSPVEKSALLVHLALADVANDMHDNELWSSLATIGKKARLGRSTVIDALEVLVDNGLLTLVEKRPGHTDLYRFEFPDLPVQYLDRRTSVPVQGSHTPVQDSDHTRPESAPELNRTQADNPASAEPIFTDLDDFEYLQHEPNPEALAALRDRFKRRADLA